MSRRGPPAQQHLGAEPHHGLGPAQESGGAAGSTGSRASGSVTKPTCPPQPAAGWSMVSSTSMSAALASPAARRGTGTRPACGPRRPGGRGGSRRARPAQPARPGAAGRDRPRRPRSQGHGRGACQLPARAERAADPEQSPGRHVVQRRLTAPTSRTVWVSVPSWAAGAPLSEMAISPTPDAHSMRELARQERGSGSRAGSSRSVTQSWVSAGGWRPGRAPGASARRPATGSQSLVVRAPVQVEQPRPGSSAAADHRLEQAQRQRDSRTAGPGRRVRAGGRFQLDARRRRSRGRRNATGRAGAATTSPARRRAPSVCTTTVAAPGNRRSSAT